MKNASQPLIYFIIQSTYFSILNQFFKVQFKNSFSVNEMSFVITKMEGAAKNQNKGKIFSNRFTEGP